MQSVGRLAVKLTNKAEQIIRRGHPWVFSDSISKIKPEGKTGDITILFSRRSNEVFAVGLYDAESAVRIKIIHRGGPAQIDSNFFKEKVMQAYELRKPLLSTDTNAYRLIFGENDDFPGFICDIYDSVAVVKLYSTIWLPYLEMITEHIREISSARSIILRMSRNLQKLNLKCREGEILYGELQSPDVIFKEHGLKFVANVFLGHKTGFFLDHRANRRKIGQLSKGKSVLDVFSYNGGFSVHALAGGASEVTSLDISVQALELARHNAELNPHKGKHLTISGDAFQALKTLIKQGKSYDIVVIDPPSFAKSEKEVPTALVKYAELAELGAELTARNGLLVLASCSSRIKADEFKQVHRETFARLDKRFSLLDFTEHDIDHPVKYEEGAYLKTAYYSLAKNHK